MGTVTMKPPGLAVVLLILSSAHAQSPSTPSTPSTPLLDSSIHRIVIVGGTGTGKSSLANALLGLDPRSEDGVFPVCPDMDSCTKTTTYRVGPWLGTGPEFTVVDTPGFGDGDGEDEKLMEEMMDILANTIDHADTILLLLKGGQTRFSSSLQAMLKRMTIMFGKDWWDHVVVGVSFWTYDEFTVNGRKCYPNYPCKDEAWFGDEIDTQLCEKLQVCKNFTYVFADSWSQTPGPPRFNTDDQLQQEHWQIETRKLWEVTTTRTQSFYFQTIDDILEENARQKREIQQLNEVISNDISQLNDKVNNIVNVPLGTIIAWVTKPAKVWDGMVNLPNGWLKCDGSTIPQPSIWAGQHTPNLNGEKRFLRGGTDAQMLTMEEDQMQNHKHGLYDPGHTHSYNDKYPSWGGDDHGYPGPGPFQDEKNDRYDKSHTRESGKTKSGMKVQLLSSDYRHGSETRPKNMNVIYIMRVF